MSIETKDKKSANMKPLMHTLKVPWPFNNGKSNVVEVNVPIAKNDKVIKKHTEIRLLNTATGGSKKRKAEMSICIG